MEMRNVQLTIVKLDEVGHLAGGDVQLDGIVHLHRGVGVADGASVVRHNEGHVLGSNGHLLDFAQLVFGLLRGDAVDGEAALDVVDQTEELAGLLDGHDICKKRV